MSHYNFNVRITAAAAFFCAGLLLSWTPTQAQRRPVSAQPVVTGPLSNDFRSALVPFRLRLPHGATAAIKLRRLPASCVVCSPSASAQQTTGKALAPALRNALIAPHPASISDAQLFNNRLDYSHDRSPDIGWIFPTRGYDLRNNPTGFRVSPNSLIYPTDAPYVGADNKTYAYPNFGAPIELIQMGHNAQISTLQVSLGVARSVRGSVGPPTLNLDPIGGVAVILFWDGVYNDLDTGFPRDDQGGYKLAQDGTGASGVLVQLGQGFNDVTINFDNDGSGTAGRFRITDPRGRVGLTIAAVYDPNAGEYNGEPLSTRQDGVYLRPGAMVGQNKYYRISDGNLDIGTPDYDGNGVATTQNIFGFAQGDSNGDIFGDTTTQDFDGSVAYQVAPANRSFNPGEGQLMTVNGKTSLTPVYAPLNSALTLYGTNFDGGHASRGELRGRIRQQGVDPDNANNPTLVVSPYNPVTAAPSVPGESKMNRFRFTFISPPLKSDVNSHTLWSPETQLPAGYSFFQQEIYAMPSYGDNSDYAPGTSQHGTTLKYNYRLRGIPTGTYSLLAQAIPIAGLLPTSGGSATVATDMGTPYNYFPGSDYAVFFQQQVDITKESLFSPPGGNLSELNYDNYTNPVTLDIKLHRLADVSGGNGGTSDGTVDTSDFGVLVGQYNLDGFIPGFQTFDIGGGVNGVPDGSVDTSDFSVLVGTYGLGVPEEANY